MFWDFILNYFGTAVLHLKPQEFERPLSLLRYIPKHVNCSFQPPWGLSGGCHPRSMSGFELEGVQKSGTGLEVMEDD